MEDLVLSWAGIGGIAFLSGLVIFLREVHTRSQFLKGVHLSGGYLLSIAGLTVVCISLLFLFLDKEPAEKE